MMLLPPKPGTCPICARAHSPEEPHDAQSLYYQYRFYGVRGRWPTWADAVAHCTDSVRRMWKDELMKIGVWAELDDGIPIADPPAESVSQPVGDPNSPQFGPSDQ